MDRANDMVYIRGDHLIVVKGGQSALDASFRLVQEGAPPPANAADASLDEIHVQSYELFRDVRFAGAKR